MTMPDSWAEPRPFRGGMVRWPEALVRMLPRAVARGPLTILEITEAEWAKLWGHFGFAEQVRAPGPKEPGRGVFENVHIVVAP